MNKSFRKFNRDLYKFNRRSREYNFNKQHKSRELRSAFRRYNKDYEKYQKELRKNQYQKYGARYFMASLAQVGNGDDGESFLGEVRACNTVNIQTLLGLNPNLINYTDRSGMTALAWAVQGPCPRTVQILIEAGADVNADIDGWTVLMLAMYEQDPEDIVKIEEIVRLLLRAGADPNAKNENDELNGMTAIIYAAKRGYQEIVRLLLRAGADPNVADGNGDTATYLCSYKYRPIN